MEDDQPRGAREGQRAKKVNEVNIHWGTGWAAIGLLRTLLAKP